jgi:hypothetical protein
LHHEQAEKWSEPISQRANGCSSSVYLSGIDGNQQLTVARWRCIRVVWILLSRLEGEGPTRQSSSEELHHHGN